MNEEMTLRDYFAGQVIGHAYADRAAWESQPGNSLGAEWELAAAREAYAMADAMLEARQEGKKGAGE